MEISDDEVDFIRADLQERGISLPSLRDGLLDHLCCMLEAETSGKAFREVYREALREFGEAGLLPLQEETTTLIQTLQKTTMNKTLRISGFLSSGLLLAGALFKFMHWPGANILLLTGTFILAVMFTPVFFMLRYKTGEVSNRNTTLAIIGAAGSMLLGLGGCFKFMFWPGATTLLYSGIATLLLGYVPIYLMSVYRKSLNMTNAISTVVLMVAVSVIIFTTTMASAGSAKTDQYYVQVLEQEEAQVKERAALCTTLLEARTDSSKVQLQVTHQAVQQYVGYLTALKQAAVANTGATTYAELRGWQGTGAAAELAVTSETYNLPAAIEQTQKLQQVLGKTVALPDANSLSRMPLGLLLLHLTQWQHDALAQEVRLLLKK